MEEVNAHVVTPPLIGTYSAPAVKRGEVVTCWYRDRDCTVTVLSDAAIPWPRCQPRGEQGGSGLWVNDDLAKANSNLTTVNSKMKQTRDLARDALEGIVDRLRDELHDIPRATPIMMETSRESLTLHRRMYTLQPDDIDLARSYVSSLYSHFLLEWLHGSREESAKTFAELQTALFSKRRAE